MKIVAFFSSSGVPVLGLSPTIRIRDLSDDSLVVTDASMSEVGDGHYQYNFSSYDKDIDYAIRCDGGNTLANSDRYTYGANENYVEDISEVLDENSDIGTILSDIGFLIKMIKNQKILSKSGSVWSLIIYDDDDVTPLLSKPLKDKNGNDITDIDAGVLAKELKTIV